MTSTATTQSDSSNSAAPAVIIRRAGPADGPAFISLVVALADYEHLTPPDDAARARLLTDAFGDRPRFEVFLAVIEGFAVGYATVFETYSTFLALPTFYLEDIFVLEAYRKRKAGFALFRHCAAEAKRRGCGRMEWTVLDWNTPSIKFYQRQGAKHLTEWYHYRLTAPEIEALLAGDAPADAMP
jgi:GNAT superfamily N-acetyltransferase